MIQKKIWSIVRNLHPTKDRNVEPVVPVSDLNEYYSSVSSVHNVDLVNCCIKEYSDKNRATVGSKEKFHFKYIYPEDIIESITSIKSKATGVDLIPIIFITMCLPVLLPVLGHLFNFSLQNGCFPDVWKLANIIPIPKTRSPKESKDYRPVSILCVLGKALEKIVHKQVTEYLNEHGFFSTNQSGFRKGHSTETALLKVADDMRKAMDERLVSLLILLDLSKAFDCVHHELLLVKLKYLGFSASTIGWFRSYLYKRQHRVYVSDLLASDWAEIVTGVPQGSVLGPLLFLIYVMDLPEVLKHCSYHMYADDIQVYSHFSASKFHESLALITSDVTNIIQFCSKHNLVLNVAKTQATIIGTHGFLTKLYDSDVQPLIINNHVIPYSKNVLNLGVIFDQTLSWTDHCTKVVQKVFGTSAQLRRNFSFIPPNIRKLLILSLAMPHFDYCSVLFTDLSVTNDMRLHRAMNACIRFITGVSRFDHISPYYQQLGIAKLAVRRKFFVCDMVLKVIKLKSPIYLYDSYTFSVSTNVRSTRSSKLSLAIPTHRTEKFHRSFLIQSSKFWNDYKLYEFVNLSPYVFRKLVRNVLT